MSENKQPSPYMTVNQVADDTDTSKWAVYTRIESGELPAYRFGTGPRAPLRIKRSDLEKAMIPVVPKNRRRDVPNDAPASDEGSGGNDGGRWAARKTEAQHRD